VVEFQSLNAFPILPKSLRPHNPRDSVYRRDAEWLAVPSPSWQRHQTSGYRSPPNGCHLPNTTQPPVQRPETAPAGCGAETHGHRCRQRGRPAAAQSEHLVRRYGFRDTQWTRSGGCHATPTRGQDALGTAGETPARLWHFYRLPTFGRSLYGCGALQLIPRELLSFSSSLERLEQHYGKQLPVREAL